MVGQAIAHFLMMLVLLCFVWRNCHALDNVDEFDWKARRTALSFAGIQTGLFVIYIGVYIYRLPQMLGH